METLFTILVVLAVLAVAAVMFVGWTVWMMLRGMVCAVTAAGRALGVGVRAGNRWITCRKRDQIRCANPKCGAMNPSVARFCRRCGHSMRKPIPVVARRAAVF